MLQRQEYEKAVAASEQYQQWSAVGQPAVPGQADDFDPEAMIPTEDEEDDEEKDEESEDEDVPKSRGKRKVKAKGKSKASLGKCEYT